MTEPNPTTPPTPVPRWGKLLNRWYDEGPVFHALRDDGSPVCGVEITLEQAREIAAIDYPEHPGGIGTPCRSLNPGSPVVIRRAEGVFLDPHGRGVWILVDRATCHLVPCPRRTPV